MFTPFFGTPDELIFRIVKSDYSILEELFDFLEEDTKSTKKLKKVDKHECKCDCKQNKAVEKADLKIAKKHEDTPKPRKAGDIGLRHLFFDGRKTIAFWDDGTQTTAIRWSGEADDPEKAVMAAMLKHYIGEDVCLVDLVRHWIREGNRATEKRAARKRKGSE